MKFSLYYAIAMQNYCILICFCLRLNGNVLGFGAMIVCFMFLAFQMPHFFVQHESPYMHLNTFVDARLA